MKELGRRDVRSAIIVDFVLEGKCDLTMWCFLGKFAKRKSLKPDLFRQAVTKAQTSPRKSRGSSPAKSSVKATRVEVEPAKQTDAFKELNETPSRTAFEILEKDSSRPAFETAIREDISLAQDGPSQEDVREAMRSLSPDSVAEYDDDSGWEDLKEDQNSMHNNSAVSNISEEKEGIADGNPDFEGFPISSESDKLIDCNEDPETLEHNPGANNIMYPSPIKLRTGDDGQIKVHSTANEDLQEVTTSPLKEDERHERTARPDMSASESDEDDEVDITEISTAEDFAELSTNGLPQMDHHNDLGTRMTGNDVEEAQKIQFVEPPHDEIASPFQSSGNEVDLDQDVEGIQGSYTKQGKSPAKSGRLSHEHLESNTTCGNKEDELANAGEGSQISELMEQQDDKFPASGLPSLRDDPDTVQVESIPCCQADELSANSPDQSPKPIVNLPASSAAPSQADKVEQELVINSTELSAALSTRTTRSGARFSDDTNLLKDFLSRAQARKLAKDSKIPAQARIETSPRRSPRKALAEIDRNSPSPQKPKDLATRPGTPPGKQRLDAFTFDDVDELTAEPMSCRRSNRTRLPTASKAPPGAPSFIPVRRADGTDPVVLQKSVAQDLAIQTRANTRRNKGQSKPPNVALQILTTGAMETTANRVIRDNGKTVGWDEKLVYYQGTQEVVEEEVKDEKRPRVRRLRGLGASNGTPAPKRVVDSGIPHGTPGPRRRGKGG